MTTIDYAKMTKKQTSELLAERGVTGAAADAIVRETAKLRHARRVDQAREASRAYAVALCDETPYASYDDSPDALASLLCSLDACGVGGTDGVSGEATDRLPAFAACGKGRKQASDGEAWSAAIGEAWGNERRLVVEARSVPPGEDASETIAAPALWVGFAPDRELPDHAVMTATVIVDRLNPLLPWVETLARAGLRRAADLPPWHERALMGVEFVGDAAAWSAIVNAVADEQAGPLVAEWCSDDGSEPGWWKLTRTAGGEVARLPLSASTGGDVAQVLASVREHLPAVAAVWSEGDVEGWVLSRLPLPAGHINRCGAGAEYADVDGNLMREGEPVPVPPEYVAVVAEVRSCAS